MRCGRSLEALINQPRFDLSPAEQAQRLCSVRAELDAAITQLESVEGEEIRHFDDH
ncbi:MAG: hypothetical protein ACPGSC_06770 [Granulosicoccaceae bacterium]